MLLFWRRGYDTTSLADLTAVMGISPTSLYAAYGNKERLFLEAAQRYGQLDGAYSERALAAEGSAHEAIARLLRGAAAAFAAPGRPRGCFIISAAINCTPQSSAVQEALRAMRRAGEQAIAARIATGIDTGELPPSTDHAALGRYVAGVIQGMSQLARDGADADELRAVADLSLRAWPVSPPAPDR
jgi:TetR/AcrR family transcriptional regulator, copper-responsive repressor